MILSYLPCVCKNFEDSNTSTCSCLGWHDPQGNYMTLRDSPDFFLQIVDSREKAFQAISDYLQCNRLESNTTQCDTYKNQELATETIIRICMGSGLCFLVRNGTLPAYGYSNSDVNMYKQNLSLDAYFELIGKLTDPIWSICQPIRAQIDRRIWFDLREYTTGKPVYEKVCWHDELRNYIQTVEQMLSGGAICH